MASRPRASRRTASLRISERSGVFIVCGIRAYRDALAETLGRDEEIEVIGGAGALDEGIEKIQTSTPELVLVDASAPDGASKIRLLVESEPPAKILALAVSEKAEVAACAAARVVGYVPPAASLDQVIEAVKVAARGDAIELLSQGAGVPTPARALDSNGSARRRQDDLTAREKEVLRLIDRGLSNKEIGQLLSIEVATVKSHVHSILQKLSLRRRSQVAAWLRARNGVWVEA